MEIAAGGRCGVKQQIGSYVVTYHPALSFAACPKVEIKLPGTEYVVIITMNSRGKDRPIVIVSPQGVVTNIPVYHDASELLRQAAQTSEGLALASIFLPVVVPDDAVLPRLGRVKKHRAGA